MTPEREIALRGAYQKVFGTPEGQMVLDHICKVAFVSQPTFVPGVPDATAHNEGMRRLALSILLYCNQDVKQLIERAKQHANQTPTEY